MGLDSLWLKREAQTELEPALHFEPPLRVMPASFAVDKRQAAFRGKAYAHAVEKITGVSLYQRWIGNETICRMAERLRAFVNNPEPEMLHAPAFYPVFKRDDDGALEGVELVQVWQRVPDEHVADLARMFTAYGAEGFGLLGWW